MAHMDAADFEAEGMAIGTTARQVLQALGDPENLTMIAYEVKYFIIELATTSQRWRRPGSTPPMSVVGTWAFDERELEDALRAAAEVRRAMRDNGRPDAGALETLKEKLEPLADAAVARD